MAVRSGAGTGVIVSLVVFVLTTVFLLVLTIVFYAGKTDAIEEAGRWESQLDTYAKSQERTSDRFKGIATSAGSQSVTAFLLRQQEDQMRMLTGDASVSMEEAKAGLERYGVSDDNSVSDVLQKMQGDLRRSQVELESKVEQLSDLDAELQARQDEIRALKESQREEIELVSREIVTYREAAEEYRRQLDDVIAELDDAKRRNRDRYEAEIAELQDENDGASRNLVLLRQRVEEYESLLNSFRAKAASPDLLVDAKVIDIEPSKELVFIDRGKNHRIVLGMTFEVYDDAASIAIDERTQMLPRGKASVQVVKVAENSSTCKITRRVAGRPVVRGNVLANAIYDPDHRFKFLVHGKFDVDGDGRPTEREAEHLRSLVIDWGGEVVTGDSLPGDLDFLVLGEQPATPPQPGPLAEQAQVDLWIARRTAALKYEELKKQAQDSQIPILNYNRFFILIGHTRH